MRSPSLQGLKNVGCILMLLLLCGCAKLFVQGGTATRSSFDDFSAVRGKFDKVQPGKTKVDDLGPLGFDPDKAPNVRRLNYPELMAIFLPNQSIRMQDQAAEVRNCLSKRERCYGLQMRPEELKNKRVGNLLADVLNFRRETHFTGWYFNALFVVLDDTVVYKLWSGESNIFKTDLQKNPLGPLQSITPNVRVTP